MLRLACCLATERNVNVLAPFHDALMVEGPADEIGEIVGLAQEAKAEASAIVLGGFQLRSDATIVRWPDRYMDGRGREFWGRVMRMMPTGIDNRRRRYRPIPVTFDPDAGVARGYVEWAGAF
jgi:hypothetical protein